MTFDPSFIFGLDLDASTREADPLSTGGCRLCERQGLPILPLRAAYAPEPWHTQALPLTRGSEVKAVRMHVGQPRTLRRGFLYVLLDRREWQAYQITPEGMLRQFSPYEIPRQEPIPIPLRCIRADHDMPAAFINIDTDKFSTAWLAIANDPWPETVLDAYLSDGVSGGRKFSERFYKLDLKTARDDPASVGFAMTEHNLQTEKILEYAQSIAGDFRSVHGFYGRNQRLGAFSAHIRTVIQREKLANGVLALVLPDPIGMVQELNAQRLHHYQAMQAWRAEPQRNFEFFTSQALLGIRDVQLDRAQQRAIKDAEEAVAANLKYHASPQFYRSPLPLLDLEEEKRRRIADEQDDARERLSDRYDEPARKKFEDHYLKTLAHWRRIIDDVATLYAEHHDGPAFRMAAVHDYGIASTESIKAFIRMLAMCQAGGPTDFVEGDTPGPTQGLWKKQLEDRDSLYYQALLAKDKQLHEQLTDDLLEGERTRVFHSIKTLIATDQGKQFMVEPVQNAIGDLLAAGATASYALGNKLSNEVKALVGHLHREALLRFNGVQVTQVTISLKVGEYLTLLNEVLYEGTERVIATLDEQFRKPAHQKVRAMLLKGQFTPALASSHAKLIDIKVWTLESAESLQSRLDTLRVGMGDGIGDALRHVSIGSTALKGSMADLARHLSVKAEAARLLARDSMRSMRNAAKATGNGKMNLALALGSLWFQQDALLRSYEGLLKSVGDGDAEAAAAVMSASVGVMGAGVEVVGATIHILRPDLTTRVVGAAGKLEPLAAGARIVQYGGALVALASAVEGVQYALAAGRAGTVGDKSARTFYGVASGVAMLSAGGGVVGSLAPAAAALLPLSIAVLFGLAAYSLAVWAKKLESDSVELWARRSLWGLPEEHRLWMGPENMDMAAGALNAALLGLTADAAMNINAEQTGGIPIGDAVPAGIFLDYKIVLPGYKADASNYEWVLQVFRVGAPSGEIIARGREGGVNEPLPAPAKNPDYHPETSAPEVRYDAEAETLEIKGSISFFGKLAVQALELEVSYWPDKSDEAGVARLIVKEDKISTWRGWSFI
ncbi:MAG: hypothetical protein LBJ37_15990 [Paucimonas sp.]|nr:hypothetical protein [Paucimonas sp.]